MDWKEEYERKFVTPEEAVRVVKDGDRVVFVQEWNLSAWAWHSPPVLVT